MSIQILTEEEKAAIEKQGADAFSKNRFNARNPFHITENTPKLTGEDNEVWTAKVRAWEAGYEMERLKRKG